MTGISAIIPCYRCADFLSEALASAVSQVVDAEVEVICVDDGGSPEIEEICSRYPVRYLVQEHKGAAAARNFGVSKARGEWIAFLDADDLWLPGKLRAQMEYAGCHPECVFVGCGVQNFMGDAREPESVEDANPVHFVNMALIRKSVFDRLGGFDEALAIGEDTDFLVRLRQEMDAPGRMGFVDETLYLRRIHLASLTAGHSCTPSDLAAILRRNLHRDVARAVDSDGSDTAAI